MTTPRRTNFKAKLAMGWAWADARRMQTLRGGSVKQYMSEALKSAWARVNSDPTVKAADELRAYIRANKAKPAIWTGRRPRGYVYGCGQR